MSACYRLVLESVCRSNHHRLAVMALRHLERDDAQAWRDLFLKHRDAYLEGAKAPDTQFKDFKNHVLHVADGYWGGAPQAAREWYRRTVRALREENWAHAAWCAGVMSHYVVDPVQPFHTGQTEEEGVIHRAAEWSFSKAFGELFEILEQDLGYPRVETPDGEDWLEQMVRAGAETAHPHYQTILDHYDFERGRRKPVDGLDQELKDVMAGLIGHATVLLARVLDRAIAEADVKAPRVNLAMDTVGVALSMPARALVTVFNDGAERRLVGQQYAEFRKTGKVRDTLSEDDKVVRALHAAEVLKVPLSSLDCQWPKETGLAHGAGAAPRFTMRGKPPSARPAASGPAPVSGEPRSPAKSPPSPAKAPAAGAPEAVRPDLAPARPSVRLSRDAAVVDAPSIGPKTASRLQVIGVNTVADLLAISPEDAARQIRASHINARIIRDWQAQAMLACSVPDLPGLAAQMLVGAGVSSVEDLAAAEPDFLMDAIELYAQSSEGERALRGQQAPARERVAAWIAAARAA